MYIEEEEEEEEKTNVECPYILKYILHTAILNVVFLLYKSITEVEANAFNSDAVEDMAADKITANSKPIKPLGKLFKMK